jgi:hypothetical protein
MDHSLFNILVVLLIWDFTNLYSSVLQGRHTYFVEVRYSSTLRTTLTDLFFIPTNALDERAAANWIANHERIERD